MVRKLTHPELLKRQSEKAESKLPFSVLVNNIRSLYNVGSIFRTSDGVGIEKIWLCGITGIPPASKISKTALDAEKVVDWEYRRLAQGVLEELREKGYQIVLLEQTEQSIPFQEFKPRGPVCLVLGNEVKGVGEDLLSLCDTAIEIEMSGLKNSLNVTVAYGIVGYHIREQLIARQRQNIMIEKG